MLISKDDPRFWDVRTRDRRIRRGELSLQEVETHLQQLLDVNEKATASVPLEEPDERARERRAAHAQVRITAPVAQDDLDDLPDDEDEDDEDDEDDDLDKD